MVKKSTCFVCIAGLLFSTAPYASPAKITSNDDTPIYELLFTGGVVGNVSSSVTVTATNVRAVNPFPNKIGSDTHFNYEYDVQNVGQGASVYVYFDSYVDEGMAIDNEGHLQYTMCDSPSAAPFYEVTCTVSAINGVATMNVILSPR